MKYNIDKAKQIQELESNKRAQDFINDAQEMSKEQEVSKEIAKTNKTSIKKQKPIRTKTTTKGAKSKELAPQPQITAESTIKGRKRPFNFYLDELLLQEVETFLQEHGKYKESKSSFMEDSLRYFLAKRKSEI